MKKAKRTGRAAKMLAVLLAVLFAAGTAAADSWPADSETDESGRKWVPKDGGGYEVWEFVGVFGSEADALESIGLKEEKPETEKGGGVAEIGGKKVKAEKNTQPVSEEVLQKAKTQEPVSIVTEEKETGEAQEDGGESEETDLGGYRWSKSWKKSRRRKNNLEIIENYTERYELPGSIIYIQDNRGSGR